MQPAGSRSRTRRLALQRAKVASSAVCNDAIRAAKNGPAILAPVPPGVEYGPAQLHLLAGTRRRQGLRWATAPVAHRPPYEFRPFPQTAAHVGEAYGAMRRAKLTIQDSDWLNR